MATKNIPSNFKDIIVKSDLIQSGPPAVYQLKPKEEDIETLRKEEDTKPVKRMTLGEQNLNKTNRTILLVGETGTGKSTLINTLVNYTMGVKWEDDVWFQIVMEEENEEDEKNEENKKDEKNEENEKGGQSKSQTSDVIVYQIFGFEDQTLPYSLTIIDTPGYGSTGGIEQDDKVSERLSVLFSSVDGVHEINAVGLVLKASENRLSDRLRYIFDSVMSLFGKNMEKKIVALITYSDGLTPKNALKALEDSNIKCAKDKKNQPVYFMFNNRQSKQKTEHDKAALKAAWDLTTGQMSRFTILLTKTSPQKLMTTIEVLKTRTGLTACIQNLKDRTELTELQQKIRQTEETLKKHEEEMKNNENFTVEADEIYKERETISGGGRIFYEGAVCCTVCEENCHYPGCTMARSPSSCEVMKKGRCTKCTGKCPVSDHVKEMKIYVNKTRKVQKTKQDVKEKFEKSKSDFEKTATSLGSLEQKMEELVKKKDQMLDESFDHVVRLEQIALNVDSVSTLVHLDFLIEKMTDKGDTEKVQKLEEMKKRMETNKGVLSALGYGFNKLAGKEGKQE